MARAGISNAGLASMLQATTSEVWLPLLELTLSDGTVYRVVRNNEDIVSNGQTYSAYAFDVTLPTSNNNEVPTAQLGIDNVDQMLIDGLRKQDKPVDVSIKVIRASSPNTIEISIDSLVLQNVQWNAKQITGTLTLEDILNATYPNHFNLFDPLQFPGLFYG